MSVNLGGLLRNSVEITWCWRKGVGGHCAFAILVPYKVTPNADVGVHANMRMYNKLLVRNTTVA